MDIGKQYDKVGREYVLNQEKFFSNKVDKATEFVKKSLPNLEGKMVLDVGCGNGKDMILYELLGASEVYGVDSSEFMVAEAKKNVSFSENIFVSSMEDMSFEDDFFDVIVGRFSMHYLESFDKAYEEFARVLKSGGVLILAVHHPLSDLVCQKSKVYGKKEVLTVSLYDDKVSISFPSHTFKEYFSDVFCSKFVVCGIDEEQSLEREKDDFSAPSLLGICALRK